MKVFHENIPYASDSAFPVRANLIRNITFLAHWHTDLELMIVMEGEIRMGINSESRLLRKGDMAVCSSGDIHFYESRDCESTILLLIFHPQIIGCPAGWPKDVRLGSPFLIAADGEADEPGLPASLAPLMERIYQELHEKKPCYDQLVTGMLYELCGLILRLVRLEPADLTRDRRRMTNMKIMQEVLDYLEAGYMNSITLEDAARQARMSLFHFSRFFKSVSGMSFTAYLNNIRVHEAEKRIVASEKPIIDIALECGFTNVRTFNRVFKQITGHPPTALR